MLTKAGSSLFVEVHDDGSRIGSIEIGRGSIIWWARSKHTGKRIQWAELVKQLENAPGREIRLKKR
jgi:hypothetical protein